MASRPITDDERQRVAELHAEGHGRNEIARRLDRSPGSITTIANDLGLSFDRTDTLVAVEARRRTNAERRADLAGHLLDDAARLRARLWSPLTVYAFGGKELDFAEREIDEPSPSDKAHLMRAVSTAATQSLRLDEYDRDGGASEGRSLAGQLLDRLDVAYRQAQAQDATDAGD